MDLRVYEKCQQHLKQFLYFVAVVGIVVVYVTLVYQFFCLYFVISVICSFVSCEKLRNADNVAEVINIQPMHIMLAVYS